MKLGANTVLFGGYDMETAFKYIAMAGYDGVEVSALTGMSDHLDVTRWREQADEVKRLAETYDLEILAMELGRLDRDMLELAFQAANAIGCPIVNCGPGGKANDEESFQQQMAIMRDRAKLAEEYGVTLCVKAHVRASVWNTPTTLRMIESVPSPFFGVDMDPSHLWRAGEEPADSVEAVIDHIKHIHIRDCPGERGAGGRPGMPHEQANGRGSVDLVRYIRVLHEGGYAGPVDLEIIGAKEYSLEQCCIIAAEARGHMQASLQACGAR